MTQFFTHAQSFYSDPSLVNGAATVYVTAIDVYCRSRPSPTNNLSGIPFPGIEAYIVPMVSGLPSMAPVPNEQVARCEYAQIMPSIDASLATTFRFSSPVPLSTGQMYAIVLVADGNEEFVFWTAAVGQINLLTTATISAMSFNGSYFQLTTDNSTWSPIAGTELTFDVSIARYFNAGVPVYPNTDILQYNIGQFEYIDYDGLSSTGQLIGGEPVYMTKGSYDTNAVCIIGNTSVFLSQSVSTWYSNSDLMSIVLVSNTIVDVRQIIAFNGTEAILNAAPSFTNSQASVYTTVPIATAYIRINSENAPNKRTWILSNSSANGSIYFSNTCTIMGADSGATLVNCYMQNIIVSDIEPMANLNLPTGTSYTATDTLDFVSTSGDGSSYSSAPSTFPVTMFVDKIIPTGPAVLLSRSNEVAQISGAMASQPSNSSIIDITITSTNDFTRPTLTGWNAIPVYFTRYYINNDYTAENTMYGNAISKEISDTVQLASGQFAEDIMAWLIAYRPIGTDFKVLAKMYNTADPDAFEDKDWTLLTVNENSTTYSSLTNPNDFVEYSYGIPNCPNVDSTFSGFMTLSSGLTNVTSTTTSFATGVVVGDLIKIYSPLFPNTNFLIASVVAIPTTSIITLDQTTANASLLGSGLKMDLIHTYKNQAFKNQNNGNIVRYYNTDGAYFDTYNQFAIKTVFFLIVLVTIPYISSARAVAISA